ncbi:sensor histidine kinase [Chryseolinea lacunae]|uniref:histidine kinase n=1 Tax=Chryseolinea lacunae TaxID=2801331 RepID=A0ABS1KU89_9BACT|nr:ATP-binding protein [Chryseolinea lacunae]MBL0742974.1 hypothetical protein [Chryseolinea lacunae]
MLLQLPIAVTAQEYFFKKYRVDEGLPSDIVKGCTQDALGYFWIATDQGIAKYDGVNFTTYRDAIHGDYAKGFFTTRNGRLLAYSDLDLVEIQNRGDTVSFKSLCPVARIANDTCLSYPKLLFEDIQGDLWVSESQAVVRLRGKTLKRFGFDIANRSTQFLRAFSFFEDKRHTLFITSLQGNVFRYNARYDEFESVDLKFPAGVEFVSVVNNTLVIGASDGVYRADLPEAGGVKAPKLVLGISLVSFVRELHGDTYFVATRSNKHFMANLDNGTFTAISYPINNINHVYRSKEDDLWISGNDGLVVMKENLFRGTDENVSDFIECIAEDAAAGIVYYATRRTLYAFDRATKKNTVVLDIPSGYFQSVVFTEEGLWVANAFKVFLLTGQKIKKQYDLSAHGRFVTTLTRDAAGTIWLTVPGSPKVYGIGKDLVLRQFNIPLGRSGVVNMIREGNRGMYVASAGKASYLFFKGRADTVFHNASVPVTFAMHPDFNVTDFVVTPDDLLWLATSEGLLKYDGLQLHKVDLGQRFAQLPVKAIHTYAGNKLLVANAFGMALFDRIAGTTDLFNESSGLLSNTITPRGLFVDRCENVWVGTAKGLCYSTRPLTVLSKTSAPQFTQVRVNGKNASLRGDTQIDYGSFLSIHVSSITFPENEVIFQYRIVPGEAWATTSATELHFSGLTAGAHTVEVRAKKNGPFVWSNSSHLHFTIAKPFWQRWWFFGLCLVAAAVLVVLTFVGVNARNRKKSHAMQRLIDARTNELRISNEELIQLNLEKNNLIGIVAHDLRNPLQQITGLISLVRMNSQADDETKTYLNLMGTSVERLDSMIVKILDVNAIDSRKLNLTLEDVNLSDICNTVADRYRHEAMKKRISIVKNIDPGGYVSGDKVYLEQVVENLLSNAIKFSPFDRNVYVNLRTSTDKVVCEIRDEGPGLSVEDKQKLFGKFQKLSARPTANETSTGLGLSIVKKFVIAMDGDIQCESEPGKGAAFSISFARRRVDTDTRMYGTG